MTVAWEVKSPFPLRIKRKDGTLGEHYRKTLITIWHVDPETDHTDDSCGWFKRARHGDKNVLEKIVKHFEEDWDRTWTYDPSEDCEAEDKTKKTYPCGYFNPSGMPRFSVTGIVLNLFFLAACAHFHCDGLTNWKKAKRFMRKHLFDIMLFAENPSDSLYDSLTLKYGNDRRRKDRIEDAAGIIYGWILRAEQKWWQHPRFHIHHFQVQIHALEEFKRWAFSRCCKCSKGFKWGQSVCTSSWEGTGPLWFRSEKNVYHERCGIMVAETSKANPQTA